MDGQIAVVTGASSGIGNAICKVLLGDHYYVLANARTVETVFHETKHLLLNSLDMLNPQTSESLLNEVLSRWNRCDLLCMNAGIIESNPIENLNIDKMSLMVRLKVEMNDRLI